MERSNLDEYIAPPPPIQSSEKPTTTSIYLNIFFKFIYISYIYSLFFLCMKIQETTEETNKKNKQNIKIYTVKKIQKNMTNKICSFSSHHLFGPSASLASHSQSSLEIILENSPGETLSPYTHRHGTILNRHDYEDISHAYGDDNEYNNDDADDDDDSKSKLSKGAQSWRNVRAVMAYYCSLRKIKRNGSN